MQNPESFGRILMVYLLFGKILDLLWQILHSIGETFGDLGKWPNVEK